MSELSTENKVVVRILGEEYPIIGVADPAHISRVADLVDTRMQEIALQSRTQARDKIAILTALSLASELIEQSGQVDKDGAQVGKLDGLLYQLDKALDSN